MTENHKLRKGYKHTALGWIPEDWEIKSLSELVGKVGSGITPRGGEKVYQKKGRPFLRSQNVGWGTLLLDDIVYISDNIHNSFRNTEIRENDVFLNITGASIGRSAVADRRVKSGNVNQHVCLIRSKEEVLDPFFLQYFLISSIGQNLINNYQAGGNRQGLNFEQIKSFSIPLPSIIEQKSIVALLSIWDKEITNCQLLIDNCQLRKKGLMQKLLTGKKRLPGFKGNWNEKPINEVFEFLITASLPRESLTYSKTQNQIFYIHYGDIHAKFKSPLLDFEKERNIPYLKDDFATLNSIGYLLDGDLVIADASEDYEGIGVCVELKNIGNNKIIGGLHTIALRDASGLTAPNYRSYLLKHPSVTKSLHKIATGISVYSISKSNLGQIKLPLPPVNEQKAIADVFMCLDTEINLLRKKLSVIKEQKKGLMQKLLTGQMRIKN